MSNFSDNLRRLMARGGLTLDALVEASGVDARTVKAILADRGVRPHARTLHKLAAGLGVPVDELFQTPSLLAYRSFDRQTNPLVDEVVAEMPSAFDGWGAADFDELYSHFGTGGALTHDGARQVVESINRKRDLLAKAALVLETDQADVLAGVIEVLYGKVVVHR
ncbi:MAG: helix-turn-helix domain-containing protein [Pirellulales bacterium]|nr:helix-turn-helix domain-containing protein [Pirellulales bacterium]